MSDRELLDALTVLAVRWGLLERGQRLAIEGDPRDEPPVALCRRRSAPDERGMVLECSKPRGHFENQCSWESAFVGIVAAACGDVAPDGQVVCALGAGHELPHISKVRDMSYDIWPVESPGIRCGAGTVCGAPSPVQPGPDCVLRAGHQGSHSNDPTLLRV